MTFDDVVAQLAHFAWGAMVPLQLARHGVPLWAGALMMLVVAGSKESIESVWGVWEPKQPWKSGAVDFAFFVLGVASVWI